MPNTQSRRIALCGVLAALGVVVLLVGSALGLGTYAAPMLACFLLLPALEEYGPRAALCQYAATAILALLLVPEPELSLFYALALGPYPVLRARLERLRRRRCAGRPSSPFSTRRWRLSMRCSCLCSARPGSLQSLPPPGSLTSRRWPC